MNKPDTITDADLQNIADKGKSDRAHENTMAEQSQQPVRFVDVAAAANLISARRNEHITRNQLYKFLREKKMLTSSNEPKTAFIDVGLFDAYLTTFKTGQKINYYFKTVVTAKGIARIAEMLDDEPKKTVQPNAPTSYQRQ